MIRAENAITSVLTIQEDKNCLGTLRTMNRFKGKVFRLDYTGERKQDSLEDWVKDEKYSKQAPIRFHRSANGCGSVAFSWIDL